MSLPGGDIRRRLLYPGMELNQIPMVDGGRDPTLVFGSITLRYR